MAVTIYTWEGALSLLAGTAGITGTVAAFNNNDKRLRQIMFVTTSLWILHNILAGSPGAVAVELVFLSSNVIGYFRYYILPKQRTL